MSTPLPASSRAGRPRTATSLLALPLAMALALTLAVLGPATEASAAPAGAPAAAPAGQALGQATAQRVAKKKKKKRKSRGARIGRATGIAVGQLGDPYRWGGTGPSAFDCSGLIYYSFRRAGVSVPRTSSQQARAARNIKKSNLRRGDLMFFHNGGRVYHAAIFLGRKNGKIRMVHAPSTGKRVERSTPWTSRWYAATLRGR